jgi:hypothetical protein
MKNSTKIIIGLLGIGVLWWVFRKKNPTEIVNPTDNINPDVTTNPDNVIPDEVIHSGTGTTTGSLPRPNTNVVTPASIICGPQDGFNVVTYSASSGTNISRVKSECTRRGGEWRATRTGGCCVSPKTAISQGPRNISSPVFSAPSPMDSCFIADTLVTTAKGKIKIQNVKVGMEVLSFNEETKGQEFSKVKETIISSNIRLVTIRTESGIELRCTKEHPFYVKDSAAGWIQAFLLVKGDVVILENSEEDVVESVEINEVTETNVYNLHVENNHTYYANGILVHNKDVTVQYDTTYTGATAQAILVALQELFSDTQDVSGGGTDTTSSDLGVGMV